MLAKKCWRVIDTKTGTAPWNMAVDEALLSRYNEGGLPILRLYGWHNALSIGRFCDPRKDLDVQNAAQKKVALVRRLSGGGILAHGNDLSYSLIFPRSFAGERSVKENYRFLCRFLICFYKKIGLKAEFACETDIQSRPSNVCLAGREPYDLVIEGKKMGGNAQRYAKHAFLQHGSIPIGIDETLFEDLFFEESGLSEAATLQKFGIALFYEELSKMLIEAFCETFDAAIVPGLLSLPEEQTAKELLENKYTQEDWNLYGKFHS